MAGACARHAVAIPFAPALPLDNGAVGYKRVLFNVGASELHGYGSGTPARGTEHLVRSMRWTEMAFFSTYSETVLLELVRHILLKLPCLD